MLSFITKWRHQRLRKKITMLYLSNPCSMQGKNGYEHMFEINLFYENIFAPYRNKNFSKFLEDNFHTPNKKD